MADETKKMLGIILVIVVVSYGAWFLKTGHSDTAEPPSLYELSRQTAENTRHIFWLLVVGFAAWSFRSYKTGR